MNFSIQNMIILIENLLKTLCFCFQNGIIHFSSLFSSKVVEILSFKIFRGCVGDENKVPFQPRLFTFLQVESG